jgi:hypothetical protein
MAQGDGDVAEKGDVIYDDIHEANIERGKAWGTGAERGNERVLAGRENGLPLVGADDTEGNPLAIAEGD